MKVKLKLNMDKVKTYNERVMELKREYPEDADYFTEVKVLGDKFRPYTQINHEGYIVIEGDYRCDLDCVYVCGLNSNHSLENLTNYKEVKNFNSPIYWCSYGVCDNASQVLDYYDTLYALNKDYMAQRDFVILLTPIVRKTEPEYGGWRWHKWGAYIGKFEPKCEYLYDEEGIDFVYCFTILEVEKC